jgi:DNA-binding NarL/FixJ family response regulator
VPQPSEPPGPPRVRLVSADMEFESALRASLDREDAFDVIGHTPRSVESPPADIVLLDAGPPEPDDEELARLRSESDCALVIVAAAEIDSRARELGVLVDVVGYLKKGVAVADVAALVLELAAVAQVKS